MKRLFERLGQVWPSNEKSKANLEPELPLDQMVATVDTSLSPQREAELRKNIEAENAYYYQLGLKLNDRVKLTTTDGTLFVGTINKIYALPPYKPEEDFFAEITNEKNEGQEINILAVKTQEVMITKID